MKLSETEPGKIYRIIDLNNIISIFTHEGTIIKVMYNWKGNIKYIQDIWKGLMHMDKEDSELIECEELKNIHLFME